MDKPRQIKFRGLSMAGEGWVYGYYRYVAFGSYENHKIYDPASRIETDVIPETVGQWTGLTDKNGTEIYDGDILKIEDHVSGSFIVFWDNYRVAWWGKNIKDRDLHYHDDFFQLLGCNFQRQSREIIGNIHVNERLIKKQSASTPESPLLDKKTEKEQQPAVFIKIANCYAVKKKGKGNKE